MRLPLHYICLVLLRYTVPVAWREEVCRLVELPFAALPSAVPGDYAPERSRRATDWGDPAFALLACAAEAKTTVQ